jgi:hypothetical protein
MNMHFTSPFHLFEPLTIRTCQKIEYVRQTLFTYQSTLRSLLPREHNQPPPLHRPPLKRPTKPIQHLQSRRANPQLLRLPQRLPQNILVFDIIPLLLN